MAETADIPEINRFVAERQGNILNMLFAGITTGEDLTDLEVFRQTLAAIPAFDDEGDHRWWWEDNIDTDLRSEPEDLEEEDIAHIRTTLETIINDAGTSAEESEIAAQLYLLSLDRNFQLPDGKTALEVFNENPIIALKGDLRWLSAPGPDNAPSIFGADFPAYEIDGGNLTAPASEDFIETFGAALRVIQTDMRNLGITPPSGNDAFINPAIIADPAQSEYQSQVVQAMINRLANGADLSEELQAISALTGAERIEALNQYVSGLDDSDANKAEMQTQLQVFGADATPMQFLELAVAYDVLQPSDLIRARLHEIHNIGADRTGMFGENTQALLEDYLAYAAGSQEFQSTHGPLRNRAAYFERLYDTYSQLPDDQKAAINAALEARSAEAPGIQLPVSPEDAEEAARQQAEREQFRGHYEVLQAAGEALGVPPAIIAEVSPRVLSGVTAAHYDEGFERGMREVFSRNWVDTYGIRRPASDDPAERLSGDENLWRYRYPNEACAEFVNTYFNTHSSNLLVQNVAGQTQDPMERYELMKDLVAQLDENDPLARGFAELTRDINANSLEYHIHPATGEITTYRVAANGVDLYTNAAPGDDTPLVLEGQYPDFDIFHPNFVTRDLLSSLSEQTWQKHFEEHRDFYESRSIAITAQPSVENLSQDIAALRNYNLRAIQSLHPDMDQDGVTELYGDLERALASPEQYYRAKLARENPDMDEDELDRRVEAELANYNKLNMMEEILRARESSESTVMQISSYFTLMNSLEDLREITAMRDYTNLMVDGLLPDGSVVTPPAIENPWGQDFSTFYDNNTFQWERATEFRTWTPELYNAYASALNNDNSISTSLFEHDDYAMAYIEAQGWSGSINATQASMVARAMMIKEAADRHNVDPNSAEARAAFLEDYQAGFYNKHDIDIMMRAFDADGPGRAARREQYNADAWRNGSFNDAADMSHRIDMFHDMFKQPVELPGLTNADGSTRVVQSTLTLEDATMMFWRDYRYRSEFNDPETGRPYDDGYYGLDYETMLERHGPEFAEKIADIMEINTFYNMNLLTDVNNPIGAFDAAEVRRYQAMYQQRLELQYKEDNAVISPPPAANVGAAPMLDPATDTITPMPASQSDEPQRDHLQAAPVDNAADLRENCAEMTELSPECAALIGSGGVTPTIPAPAPDPALAAP